MDKTERFVANFIRPAILLTGIIAGGVLVAPRLGLKVPSQIPQAHQPPVTLEGTKTALNGRGLMVRGSTSAADLVPLLRSKFQDQGVSINSLMLGSDKGISDLRSGKADIAFSSKRPEEADLVAEEVANERVVFFVGLNSSLKRTSLSDEEGCRIYRGELQKWSEVEPSGANAIRFYDRSNGGTLEWIRKKCGARSTPSYSVLPDGTTRLFSLLSEDPAAIGYGSERQAQSMVRAVPVEGWERKIYVVARRDSEGYIKKEVIPRVIQVLK